MTHIALHDFSACELHDHVVDQMRCIRVQENGSDKAVKALSFQNQGGIECAFEEHGLRAGSKRLQKNSRDKDHNIDRDQDHIHIWDIRVRCSSAPAPPELVHFFSSQ